ncbi:MAG TPA: hypothetical protein VGO09_05360 [Flavisolibacter sp.]|nr:hypothetical protein [Flavisolibacter sp.]
MKRCLIMCLMFLFSKTYSQNISIDFSSDVHPRIFGPGIISDGFDNRDMAISPDNKDMFFTIQYRFGPFSVIMHSKKEDTKWTTPEVALFSGNYNDLEASFTPDGKRIYFSSNRPLPGNEKRNDYNIWYVEKEGNTWGKPVNAGTIINSEKDEFFPYVTISGNIYFTRDNDSAKDDIFCAEFVNGQFSSPMPLPETVNSKSYDFNAYVDPREEFLIFSSYQRGDDKGGDLYISIRKDGKWQTARNLGNDINSPNLDYSPFVSYDRKYLFFTSRRMLINFPLTGKKNIKEIKKILSGPGNGSEDIYITNFSILKDFFH